MSGNIATETEREHAAEAAMAAILPQRNLDRQALASAPNVGIERAQRQAMEGRVTTELVLRELRAHSFAVLSTVDEGGAPDSAGVNYGVTSTEGELALYVMTRRHLKKARNIAQNPRVSLVVPLPRRILQFVPPATIQLRGRAQILDWTDPEGTDVFRRFWMGRRILAGYEEARRRGETRVCFLKITPDPVIRTYAVGYSAWELRRHMESAAATVRIPAKSAEYAGGLAHITIGGTDDNHKTF